MLSESQYSQDYALQRFNPDYIRIGVESLVTTENMSTIQAKGLIQEDQVEDFYEWTALNLVKLAIDQTKTYGGEIKITLPHKLATSLNPADRPVAEFLPYMIEAFSIYFEKLPEMIQDGIKFDVNTLGATWNNLEKFVMQYFEDLEHPLDPSQGIGQEIIEQSQVLYLLLDHLRSNPGLLNKQQVHEPPDGSLPDEIAELRRHGIEIKSDHFYRSIQRTRDRN